MTIPTEVDSEFRHDCQAKAWTHSFVVSNKVANSTFEKCVRLLAARTCERPPMLSAVMGATRSGRNRLLCQKCQAEFSQKSSLSRHEKRCLIDAAPLSRRKACITCAVRNTSSIQPNYGSRHNVVSVVSMVGTTALAIWPFPRARI